MSNSLEKQRKIQSTAKNLFPGGVNSPVRNFQAVKSDYPLFIESAKGAFLTDNLGHDYCDFILSWGATIIGHCDKTISQAISEQANKGISYGISSTLEIDLANIILSKLDFADKIRFVNSGTEATMSALRLARAYTQKNNIIKFDGHYHGHNDALLVKTGSGFETFENASSAGIPESFTQHTFSLIYNDCEQLIQCVEQKHKDIAALILEPITGNMGVVEPTKEFVETINRLAKKYNILIICDEIMSGMRMPEIFAYKQFFYNVDIICLGKVIGGGTPIGAFAARNDIMDCLAPEGGVYQAGTFSGNPLTMAAGIAQMSSYDKLAVNKYLVELSNYLALGLKNILERCSKISFIQKGGMFSLFFRKGLPKNFDEVKECDMNLFAEFFQFMLAEKLLIPPSQYEANFLSHSHTKKDMDNYIKSLKKFLEKKKLWD